MMGLSLGSHSSGVVVGHMAATQPTVGSAIVGPIKPGLWVGVDLV